jgi:signal transduction histidine kinase
MNEEMRLKVKVVDGFSEKNSKSDMLALSRQQVTNLEYQREILTYITEIGASLRLQMDTDTLLKRVSEATCRALHFRHSALYLSGGTGYFHVRAVSGVNADLEVYLNEHPLPDAVVERLLDEKYRMSNSYFIPAEAELWLDELVASYFVIVEEDGSGGPAMGVPDLSPGVPSHIWRTEDLLVVPLRDGDGNLLGFLTPDAPEDNLRPTAQTLAFLELFVNQAAVVIEGAHLYEEARRSSEERAVLIEIGRALSSPEALRDLQSVYQTIYEQVKRIMPADAFFVSRYNKEPEELVMDYLIDKDVVYPSPAYEKCLPQTREFLYENNVGLIFSTAEEYAVYAEGEDALAGSEDDLFGTGQPSQSLLFVPIRYGAEPIGLLSVQSYAPHVYTRRHLELLREIGVQAGIAITNARLNAELREALKQAQESERVKNHFLMTASHELRTPLTAIQGYLELLDSFYPSLDDEARMRFVTNARRACDELVLLLSNVMDTSRIDQDKVALTPGAVRVIQAVEVILEIMEPTLAREQRQVDVQIDEWLSVWADDLRLRQVLLNIVGNAVKYSPPLSPLAISAECVSAETLCERLSLAQQAIPALSGSYVVIAVRDRGPGISQEDQRRLFTRFMRLDSALNSTQRGAGLGLYLCRQLIEAMGGVIWVESAGIPGEGSTFFIAIPQHEATILEEV